MKTTNALALLLAISALPAAAQIRAAAVPPALRGGFQRELGAVTARIGEAKALASGLADKYGRWAADLRAGLEALVRALGSFADAAEGRGGLAGATALRVAAVPPAMRSAFQRELAAVSAKLEEARALVPALSSKYGRWAADLKAGLNGLGSALESAIAVTQGKAPAAGTPAAVAAAPSAPGSAPAAPARPPTPWQRTAAAPRPVVSPSPAPATAAHPPAATSSAAPAGPAPAPAIDLGALLQRLLGAGSRGKQAALEEASRIRADVESHVAVKDPLGRIAELVTVAAEVNWFTFSSRLLCRVPQAARELEAFEGCVRDAFAEVIQFPFFATHNGIVEALRSSGKAAASARARDLAGKMRSFAPEIARLPELLEGMPDELPALVGSKAGGCTRGVDKISPAVVATIVGCWEKAIAAAKEGPGTAAVAAAPAAGASTAATAPIVPLEPGPRPTAEAMRHHGADEPPPPPL